MLSSGTPLEITGRHLESSPFYVICCCLSSFLGSFILHLIIVIIPEICICGHLLEAQRHDVSKRRKKHTMRVVNFIYS